MPTPPTPAYNLRRFWPALLGAGSVYPLWPLLWLGFSAPTLLRQEPDAGQLFAAAPAVYFTGKPKHFQESGVGGRFLFRNRKDIQPFFVQQGWQFIVQMGGGYFFERQGKRLTASCTMFSRHFTVCNVI